MPQPIFTPATKASWGTHDETSTSTVRPRSSATVRLLEELRRLSLAIYERGAEHARERGIILADTKFEFGRRADRTIVLGDEVMTPDSSRFWPADGYQPGRAQPSFDKQFVRDWASGSGWDKTPPAPELPDDVVDGTRQRYVEAYDRIAGEPFERGWSAPLESTVLIRPSRGSSTRRAGRRGRVARARAPAFATCTWDA